jgi:UTP--glucose-1-phosphate uridylyltransferase
LAAALEDYFDPGAGNRANAESLALDALLERVDLFFVRQKAPRGLGDAIAYAEPFAGGEPFAVLLGDEFTRPSCLPGLLEAHARHGSPVVAVEHVVPDLVSRYGVVAGAPWGDDLVKVDALVEKPQPQEAPSDLAILGAYVLTSAIFPALARTAPDARGEVQLTDALRLVAGESGLFAQVAASRRYDIGTPSSWLLTNLEFGLADPEVADAIRALVARR